MYKRIVVGTDGSARARQAVVAAAQLATTYDAELHVVQAYRPASQLVAAAMVAPETAAIGYVSDAEVAAQVDEHLERLRAELRDVRNVQTYACPQAAAPAILAVADHQQADLIVVGSKGMHGARRVLGSVPNTIAHQAACAVLIVPTDG